MRQIVFLWKPEIECNFDFALKLDILRECSSLVRRFRVMSSIQELARRLQTLFDRQDVSYEAQLSNFFDRSTNVFADTLSFLSHLSATGGKSGVKSSLAYIVVQKLDQFVKTSVNRQQLLANQLTQTIRWNALQFALKKRNQTWLDIIVDVYHLKSLKTDAILEVIEDFISKKQYFDAALVVIKFQLTDHFDIQQILVPILFQVCHLLQTILRQQTDK